jgi:molybdopterin molybdotransferase
MEIEIHLTDSPIPAKFPPPVLGPVGAWLEFRGLVRGEENDEPISGLEYEAYPEMAEREIRRLLESLARKYPCLAARVIHRFGSIPVGDPAIYVGVAGRHRQESIALLAEFMDRLKQDVPIWKRRALPVDKPPSSEKSPPAGSVPASFPKSAAMPSVSLDEAMAGICSACQPLPNVRLPLSAALGQTLRETVCATENLPARDLSTRDGYAILTSDSSKTFVVVDTVHAADWKPRDLQPGQAVRVATGASLPGANLRVIMQEDVERHGDSLTILRDDRDENIRRCGEEMKAGQSILEAGLRLDAGKLALLATAGCTHPLVSPRLNVVHFTTGDEIVSPDRIPGPGQIRDSNSILVRGLLQPFVSGLEQTHLPENFEAAWARLDLARIEAADMLLVSGGSSVGDLDFTRPLLERLGFKIVFARVNIRPGKPLIFGVNGPRIAFGLPGNPLAHFVCLNFAVATAIACLRGEAQPEFLRGPLATSLTDAPCPRETLWPVRLQRTTESTQLQLLPWASSGDITCLAAADALLRVPAGTARLDAGAELEYLRAMGASAT